MSAGILPFGFLSRFVPDPDGALGVSAALQAAQPQQAPNTDAPTAPAVPLRMFGALPPQMPAPVAPEPAPAALPSLVGSHAPAMPAPAPAAPRGGDEAPPVSPPARPLGFGALTAPVSPAPATNNAVPAAGSSSAAPAKASPAAEPSFLDRLGNGLRSLKASGGDDLLMSLGIGLMSTPGFGRGAAAGLKAYQDNEGKRAASALATAEFGLKARKAQQEQQQLTGNAQYAKNALAKAGQSISDEQALTLGGNSAFMNKLFEGSLPATEVYKQFTDKDGNVWSQNSRTGQATVALQAKDDKTVTQVPEADRVALGLPAGSYQRDANGKISSINPTGTTINMGAEKAQDATVGKAYGDYQVDLATKGRNAGNTLNSLALMEQAARNPNFYSGTGAEAVKRASQFLVAMGVKDANYTKPTEVFDALSNKVVLDGLGGSLGPGISNTDRDYIGRTAPTLAQSQAGNLELIAIARSLAQRQQAVSKLARDYAAANGGRLDSGFDQKLEEYAGANPLFPAAQAAATQRSDGATGANGPGGIAAPRTQADFDALPKGAMYVDPSDGRRYRKN